MNHGSSDARTPLQWRVVVLLGAVTMFLGTRGVWKYESDLGHHQSGFKDGGWKSLPGDVYHAVQMLVLHTPHFEHRHVNCYLEWGRWFGVLTTSVAAIVLFQKRLRRGCKQLLLMTWEGHFVVCGLGQKGFEIVLCQIAKHRATRIVIIDPTPDPALAEKCESHGACVMREDASRPDVLARARVIKAGQIVVITEADQINVRIAAEVRNACVAAGARPACHVHLSDIHLRDALDRWVDSEAGNSPGRLHFFDVFDAEARRLLRDHPLDATGIGHEDPNAVHVVILGFGRMGRSLALRAAKIGHFANGKRLRISVIDRHADTERERFLFRYPVLADDRICQLQFHTMEAESLQARVLIEQWIAEPATHLHIFTCLDDDARGLEVALRLQGMLRGRKGCGLRVRIRSKHSLAPILRAADDDSMPIVAFGAVEDSCADDAFREDELDALARAIHREFVERRIATSQRKPGNDPALRDWEELPDGIRESNRQQADHLRVKLRAIGCELVDAGQARERIETLTRPEIGVLAPIEHQRWNAERWLAGWRYGTPGDKSLRISPHLAPWEEVDPSIQKYDLEAIEQIPALVLRAMPGKKIVRLSQPPH